MTISPPPSTNPEVSRADAEPIDWENVAVETEVMLRLQQAPPVASARQGQPQSKG